MVGRRPGDRRRGAGRLSEPRCREARSHGGARRPPDAGPAAGHVRPRQGAAVVPANGRSGAKERCTRVRFSATPRPFETTARQHVTASPVVFAEPISDRERRFIRHHYPNGPYPDQHQQRLRHMTKAKLPNSFRGPAEGDGQGGSFHAAPTQIGKWTFTPRPSGCRRPGTPRWNKRAWRSI